MKNIMRTKNIYGSTLVEVLVSVILVGILMISATTFFVVAWRLDAEQQEYFTVLNNIANTLEIGINTMGNALGERRRDSFRGIYFDYDYLVKNISDVNSNCRYLICKPNTSDSGMNFFVLKTACYQKWDKEGVFS